MKKNVKHINMFLKNRGMDWCNQKILDATGKFVKATDEDFSKNEMQTILLPLNSDDTAVKQVLVNENLFLVFDALGNKLEKDFSTEWKNYLEKIKIKSQKIDKEVEEKIENFNAYLEESIDE